MTPRRYRRLESLRDRATLRGLAYSYGPSPAGVRLVLGGEVLEGPLREVLAEAHRRMPFRRPGAPRGNRNACRANRIAKAAREAYQWR